MYRMAQRNEMRNVNTLFANALIYNEAKIFEELLGGKMYFDIIKQIWKAKA